MRLSTKYLLAFSGLAAFGFIGFAAVNAIANYQENVERVAQIQQEEGKVIATQISAYLESIARQLHDVNGLPWAQGLLDLEDERAELHRLLKLNPAIYEIRSLGPRGEPRNLVSRVAPDGRGPELPTRNDRRGVEALTNYSAVYFREGSTPYISMSVHEARASSPALIAELSLRYVADLVANARIGAHGTAYVVDRSGELVAHPNLSMVHRKLNLSSSEQVHLSSVAPGKSAPISMFASSPENGRRVLTSALRIWQPEWTLFVEQPVEEVMAPVRASLIRSAWLLVALLFVGLIMSRWLASRLTRPIVDLQKGASAVASGDLAVQIPEDSDDELGVLAREFNRMTKRVEQSYASLEEKIAAATNALRSQASEVASLNAQLQASVVELAAQKEEAERANAGKTRFLAAASHDLRQPLQAISLLVGILRERARDREIAPIVDKVQFSVQALEGLFVSLLDVSRLDAGAVQPKVEPFDISNLLSFIEATFLPQALARGLRLDVVKCRGVVDSDAALLERILGNLVSNAIRYTDTGRILIGCRRRGASLVIQVIDTGPGIETQLHEAIFGEFFQIASRRDQRQGLGLGLAIVRRTADVLGHRLVLRSAPGRGSMFGIEVPLVPSGVTVDIARHGEHVQTSALIGAFVLVLDDDKENCFAIEALCIQWGCHVVSGTDLDVVVERLGAHLRSPDLIIMDYRLSGELTGLDAIDRLRGELEIAIPAVVMTGDMSISRSDLVSHPRTALLHKPIEAGKLLDAARSLLCLAALRPTEALPNLAVHPVGEAEPQFTGGDDRLSARSHVECAKNS